MQYTYWEHTEDGHQKFWAASVIEKKQPIRVGSSTIEKTVWVLIRKWGKIGTEGQSMTQTFSSEYEAQDALQRLIWDKERKGYKGVF